MPNPAILNFNRSGSESTVQLHNYSLTQIRILTKLKNFLKLKFFKTYSIKSWSVPVFYDFLNLVNDKKKKNTNYELDDAHEHDVIRTDLNPPLV